MKLNTPRVCGPVAAFLVWSVCVSAVAQTLYVKPSSEITMRRGQGTDYKIIAVVRDGTAVELLAEQDDWARVRLPSGKEGWVLSRYLSEKPPLNEQVEILEGEKAELTATVETLQQRLDSLTNEKEQIENNLRASTAALNEINDKYVELQQDTADVVKTKNDLNQAVGRVADLEQQVDRLRGQNDRLSRNQTLKWFLAGGGVLFVGWLIGLASGKSRRKRSSLL